MFLSSGRVLLVVVADSLKDGADLEDMEVQVVDAVVAELDNRDIEMVVLVDTAAAAQAQEALLGAGTPCSEHLWQGLWGC